MKRIHVLILFLIVTLFSSLWAFTNPIGYHYSKTEIENIERISEQMQTSVTTDSTNVEEIETIVVDIHDTDLPAVKTVIDAIRNDVTAIHDTNLPAVKTDTGAIRNDVTDMHDTDLPLVKTDTGAIRNDMNDIHDTDLPAVKTDTGDIRTDVTAIHDTDLPAVKTDTGNILGDLYAGTKIAITTEDLNQAAASYTLFTGTTADVILESISLRNANVDCSDDATFTGISIQTDDATVTTFITQAAGVKANLTEEAQIAWTGSAIIKVNTIITLTIYGAATDATCEPDIMVTYRSTGTGTGTLVP